MIKIRKEHRLMFLPIQGPKNHSERNITLARIFFRLQGWGIRYLRHRLWNRPRGWCLRRYRILNFYTMLLQPCQPWKPCHLCRSPCYDMLFFAALPTCRCRFCRFVAQQLQGGGPGTQPNSRTVKTRDTGANANHEKRASRIGCGEKREGGTPYDVQERATRLIQGDIWVWHLPTKHSPDLVLPLWQCVQGSLLPFHDRDSLQWRVT